MYGWRGADTARPGGRGGVSRGASVGEVSGVTGRCVRCQRDDQSTAPAAPAKTAPLFLRRPIGTKTAAGVLRFLLRYIYSPCNYGRPRKRDNQSLRAAARLLGGQRRKPAEGGPKRAPIGRLLHPLRPGLVVDDTSECRLECDVAIRPAAGLWPGPPDWEVLTVTAAGRRRRRADARPDTVRSAGNPSDAVGMTVTRSRDTAQPENRTGSPEQKAAASACGPTPRYTSSCRRRRSVSSHTAASTILVRPSRSAEASRRLAVPSLARRRSGQFGEGQPAGPV